MTSRDTLERAGRKARTGAAGAATIAVGVIMLPLPGPGSLVILAGLTVLGREFPRAKQLADRGWGAFGRLVTPMRARLRRDSR